MNEQVNVPRHAFQRTIVLENKSFIPLDICVISSKKQIVISSCRTTGCDELRLYDENFQLLKSVKTLRNTKIAPYSMDSNQIDKIYFWDFYSNKLYAIDFNLNYLNSVDLVINGDKIETYGMCYANDKLFLCDNWNFRLAIFDKDLNFVKFETTDLKPYFIKILENIVCIRHSEPQCISFYDLNTFTLKYRYWGHNGFIFLANNTHFIEYSQLDHFVYFYNTDGTFNQTFEVSSYSNDKTYIRNPFAYFNDQFIFAFSSNNLLHYKKE